MKTKLIKAGVEEIENEVNKWLDANKDKIQFVFATQGVNSRSTSTTVLVMIYYTTKK